MSCPYGDYVTQLYQIHVLFIHDLELWTLLQSFQKSAMAQTCRQTLGYRESPGDRGSKR